MDCVYNLSSSKKGRNLFVVLIYNKRRDLVKGPDSKC